MLENQIKKASTDLKNQENVQNPPQNQSEVDYVQQLNSLYGNVTDKKNLQQIQQIQKQNNLSNEDLRNSYVEFQKGVNTQNQLQKVTGAISSGKAPASVPTNISGLLTPAQLQDIKNSQAKVKQTLTKKFETIPLQQDETKVEQYTQDFVNEIKKDLNFKELNETIDLEEISGALGMERNQAHSLIKQKFQESGYYDKINETATLNGELATVVNKKQNLRRDLMRKNPNASPALIERLMISSSRSLDEEYQDLIGAVTALSTEAEGIRAGIGMEMDGYKFEEEIGLRQKEQVLGVWKHNTSIIENRNSQLRTFKEAEKAATIAHSRGLQTLEQQHKNSLTLAREQAKLGESSRQADFNRNKPLFDANLKQIEVSIDKTYHDINAAAEEREQYRSEFTPTSLLGGPRTENTALLGAWFETGNTGSINLNDKDLKTMDEYLKTYQVGSVSKDANGNLVFKNTAGETDLGVGVDALSAYIDIKGYKTAESALEGLLEKTGVTSKIKRKALAMTILKDLDTIDKDSRVDGSNGADIKQKLALEVIKSQNPEAYKHMVTNSLLGENGYIDVSRNPGILGQEEFGTVVRGMAKEKTWYEKNSTRLEIARQQGITDAKGLEYFADITSLETKEDLEKNRILLDTLYQTPFEDKDLGRRNTLINSVITSVKKGDIDGAARALRGFENAAIDASIADASQRGQFLSTSEVGAIYKNIDLSKRAITTIMQNPGGSRKFGAIGGRIDKVVKNFFNNKAVIEGFEQGSLDKGALLDLENQLAGEIGSADPSLLSIVRDQDKYTSHMEQLLSKDELTKAELDTLPLLLDGALINIIRTIRVQTAGSAVTGPELSSLKDLIDVTRRDSGHTLLANLSNLEATYISNFNVARERANLKGIHPSQILDDAGLVGSYLGLEGRDKFNFLRQNSKTFNAGGYQVPTSKQAFLDSLESGALENGIYNMQTQNPQNLEQAKQTFITNYGLYTGNSKQYGEQVWKEMSTKSGYKKVIEDYIFKSTKDLKESLSSMLSSSPQEAYEKFRKGEDMGQSTPKAWYDEVQKDLKDTYGDLYTPELENTLRSIYLGYVGDLMYHIPRSSIKGFTGVSPFEIEKNKEQALQSLQ